LRVIGVESRNPPSSFDVGFIHSHSTCFLICLNELRSLDVGNIEGYEFGYFFMIFNFERTENGEIEWLQNV